MTQKTVRNPDRPMVMIAVVLFAVAFITYWDASHMKVRATYGMSASAASYFVAMLFLSLAVCHLISAFKPSGTVVESADWVAVGWIGAALAGLIGSIWLSGGFILGSTLLFVLTARAFGRKALLADLALGAAIGVLVFLFFNQLLTLALPQGPLERLF